VAGNSSARGESVASRLLRVLDAFSVERPELGLTDISRTTGLPPATAYRLLRELIEHGAVQRTAAGRYAVGLRLWEIGRLTPTVSRLDEVAMPYLQDLYQATHGSVHLAVSLGADAVYVSAINGHQPVRPLHPPGTRVSLASPGIGQVLLAYAPAELLHDVLADDAHRTGERLARSTYGLRQSLADIRRYGLAVSRDGIGSFSAAAPVFRAQATIVAAVSVAVRAPSDGCLVGNVLRCTAAEISRELGAPKREFHASKKVTTPASRRPPGDRGSIFHPVRYGLETAGSDDERRPEPGRRPA
jgi:DNA-binding IclR family transcriptional regulator